MKTLDDLLDVLANSGTTEGIAVRDMLESIAGNDDEEMQTPAHLIVCLDELIGWAKHAQKELQKFPKDQPMPRAEE